MKYEAQRTDAWFDKRRGRLTGSNVGAALGLNPWKTPDDLIRQMVRDYHGADKEWAGSIATEYGTLHEPLALSDYQNKTGNIIDECGFFTHPDYDWLGASPDGLIDDDGLVECKCPFGLRNKKGESLVFKRISDQPHYHAQMQVQMSCTGRAWTDFYQWTPGGDSLEVVYFDQTWWAENLPRLKEFYDFYLSEIDNEVHLNPL